jgi:hypothetical protein
MLSRTALLLPVLAACIGSSSKDDDSGADTGSSADTGDSGAPPDTFTHPGGVLSGGATWAAGIHTLESGLIIEDGVLELAPCSTVLVPAGAAITVRANGAIRAVGTPDCPVTIQSAQGAPAAGDWAYIEIFSDADGGNTVFQHAVVLHAGGAAFGAIWLDAGASAQITDTRVALSGDHGVEAELGAELRDFRNNKLEDNALTGVSVGANEADQLLAGTYGPNDAPGITVRSAVVDHDATWLTHDEPWMAEDGFAVGGTDDDARLSLGAGAILALGDNVELAIRERGAFAMRGTAEAPALLTSTKPEGAPGDWASLSYFAGSIDADNALVFTTVAYGGGAGFGAVWVDSGASVAIENSTIRDSADCGVEVETDGALGAFAGNTVTGNALHPVSIPPSAAGGLAAGVYTPNGAEGIEVRNGTLASTATWQALGVPWVAPDGFTVRGTGAGATLTLAAGNTLRMGPLAVLSVEDSAAFVSAGTSAAPNRIESSLAAPRAGDWGEIDLFDGSMGSNALRYTTVAHGGGLGYGQLWVEDGAAVTLDHATFTAGEDCDLDVEPGGSVSATASTYAPCP